MKFFQAYLHLLFFLSITATTAKYAKTGCSDKCGSITIPFPFGISEDCSANQWYVVDCKNSIPYLSALDVRLEVLGISLDNQTVTVSMPRMRISNCQNPVLNSSQAMMSVDLSRSPFFFSKTHNKLVLEGCGVAFMTTDNGRVVTGCSTACLNVTRSDRNNCFGNGCCQTAIPHHLQQHSINIAGSEEEDGSCGSAFFIDETLYDEGRVSDPFMFMNASFIPVSLLWTLTDSDQITCCHALTLERLKVDVFNDSPIDTLKCHYYGPSLEANPYLKDGCNDKVTTAKYAKPGCNNTCGNVSIPFPFGIGAVCSVNKWYIVDCNSSTPYLPALNHLEVLGVSLKNKTVTVSTPRITDCQNPGRNSSDIMGVNLDSSPFLFSGLDNKFVFEGCGTAAMHMDNGIVVTACSTACHGVTLSDRNNCFGIGCCQTAFSGNVKSYKINITGLEEEDGACGSAFLVDQTLYDKEGLSINKNTNVFPVSLMWTLTDSDQVTCCLNRDRFPQDMFFMDGTTVYTWECFKYSFVKGNPYLIDGCTSNNDEEDPTEECRRCKDKGGYCMKDRIYYVDGSVVSDQNYTCYGAGRISKGVILGNVFSFYFCF